MIRKLPPTERIEVETKIAAADPLKFAAFCEIAPNRAAC